MSGISSWLEAARLKTLPLAVSTPLMGSFLAWSEGEFRWGVFVLAILTTLLLQILSNLANDYGDFVSGADNEERVGPRRLVHSGLISKTAMKRAIIANIILALISGLLLISFGAKGKDSLVILAFLVLGVAAIVAAIKYTIGKNPYGYRGLGDISVFLFFGLIGVLGTHYLHTGDFNPWHALPASAIGLLSAGVLNLNNMRDYESDKKANKRTLVVWLGNQRAKYYHLSLIIVSALLGPLYVIFNYHSAYQFLFVLAFPLFFRNVVAVFRYSRPIELYPELKRLALATLVFVVMFGLGMVI
ncbi:MAG: 1,4-dihydroxy-2-naphthoate polyprenyltransferase [Bacteroidota bacterium]